MAQYLAIFQFITIFLVCLVLKSTYVDSTKDVPCSFPPGSIACKMFENTFMDCSLRELVCIPPIPHKTSLELLDLSNNEFIVLPENVFSGFIKLQTLNLSSNKLSTINSDTFRVLPTLLRLDLSYNKISSMNGTFTGLSNLTMLDLSHNSLSFISGSPFQHLHSLKTLALLLSYQKKLTVTPKTFVGLNHTLQNLYISVTDMITYTPFIQLSSLQHLELRLEDPNSCNYVNESLFLGLDKLKYLRLKVHCTTGLCKLECIIDFSPLISLTNLSYDHKDLPDSYTYIQTLNSLNSSLETLELYPFFSTVWLNSSTFESLPKWRESLTELNIYIGFYLCNIQIEGSLFKWFPQLQRLRIEGYRGADEDSTTSWTYPENIFKGVANLKEVHLNFLDIGGVTAAHILNTPATYSLKVLDLANNKLTDKFDDLYLKIRELRMLETLSLSNSFDDRTVDWALPARFNNSIFTTLNVDNMIWYIFYNSKFSKLVSFHSSNSSISTYSNTDAIHAPCLEELYLSGITLFMDHIVISAIKVLRFIDVPQLKILDLSSSKIKGIDKEDALRLRTVTYLDLRDNLLTSLSNLTHLYNVKELLLGGNQLYTVPMSLLSNNPLRILDLHDNTFVCGCNIEGLRKWVLTDEVVYLRNDYSDGQRYKCVGPEVGPKSRYSITEIDLDCEVPLLMYISVSVTGGLVIIIAAILAVRYRWHIQYRLFLLFKRRAYQNYLINDDDVDDDFEDEDGFARYDAYVIYQNQDEDWVDEQLVKNIEEDHEEPFRMCLKNRDIRAGRLIFNELSLHIRRSRKTLVILTPCFVDDNWCYFQLNMAHHRVLEESHNVLIFIILEKIPDNRLTLLLRQLFCKSQCLKWPNDEYGQNLFWQRLREELKRPVPRDRIHRYRRYNI